MNCVTQNGGRKRTHRRASRKHRKTHKKVKHVGGRKRRSTKRTRHAKRH